MSAVSFTSAKRNVQDLIASLPAPAKPAVERSRSDESLKEPKLGFRDLLRDSTQSQPAPSRVEKQEAPEASPRPQSSESDHGTEAERAAPDGAVNDSDVSSESASQEESSETDDTTDGEPVADQPAESKPTESADQTQAEIEADLIASQLNAVAVAEVGQPQDAAPSSITTQSETKAPEQSAVKAEWSEQKLTFLNTQSPQAALPSQGQSATNSTTQLTAGASIQPAVMTGSGTTSSSDDQGAESKTSTSTGSASATTATSNSSTAVTAFAVSDPSASESKLPVNPAANVQSADASRIAQPQAGAASSDADALNTARLTRGLANAVQQRGGAVTLRLTPPEMGTVRIQMQITGTSVSASFHAESASAQTLLTTQLAQLRSALESKGMSVDRLSVQPMASVTHAQNTQQSQNQGDAQQQNQSQQQSAGDGRSRGQYSGDSSGRQSQDQRSDHEQPQQTRRGFFDRLHDASAAPAA